jgi:type I restriction enzyme S subunit
MAKYQRYAEYKDSGVEWLGAIPSHWIGTQVKYGYQVTLGKMLQSSPKSFQDELKPYLKAQNIQPKGISLIQVEEMWFSPDECKKLLLKKGDVLVSEGGDVGRSAIWNAEIEECYIQNAINRVRPKNTHDAKFFLYWMLFLKSTDFINIICNKATIAHYTAEKLEASPLVLPTSDEQVQIANFLDHETAKIDSLIEKQQQLIELLKEKRQAVISHAVTKGLDPNVPMKDSGVEWLGDVPEHWITLPLKLCVDTRKGVAFKAVDFCDSGIRVVKASDIKQKTIRESDVFLPVNYLKEYPKAILKTGELVLSTVGSTPDVKNSAVGQIGKVPESLNNSLLNQNTVVYSAKKNLDQNFLFYVVQADSYRDYLDLHAHGTANQASLNIENMLGFKISTPDLNEQKQITAYLDRKMSEFEKLEQHSLSIVDLLVERRTALISSAVTGKIDVRNWQAPNATEREMEVST